MAGTLTVTTTSPSPQVSKYSLAWVSDASGNVNANAFAVPLCELLQVRYVPDSGGTQPTDLYDVTITDSNSIDILGGGGANLSNATSTATVPAISTYFKRVLEAGNLTPNITNAGNAKGGTITLLVRKL